MNIPVDGVLIWGSGVLCNESAITGESIEMKKESFDTCMERKQESEVGTKGMVFRESVESKSS